MTDYFYVDFVDAIHFLKLKEKLSGKIVGKWDGMEDVVSALSYNVKNVVILLPQGIKKENVDAWLFVLQKELKERNVFLFSSNPQPIGFRGNILVKRQKFFYCTYSLGITETS